MSIQIRTVLAGFDGTYGSEAGLRLAKLIAATANARLVVAAALDYEWPAAVPATTPTSPPEMDAARRHEFGRIFLRACEILGPTAFQRRRLTGSPAAALSDCAEEEGADLIVLGPTHHGPAGRVFPGSVGQKVLNGASRPVAVAPMEWDGKRIGSVAAAFDGSAESEHAVGIAASLAARSRAGLRLVSVLPTHMIVRGRTVADEEMREQYRDRLEDAVRHLPGHGASGALLEHGDGVAETLREECARHDLLVLGSRGFGPIGRVFLGSVAAKLLVAPRCPLLVVPRPAVEASDRPTGDRESAPAAA